MIQFQYFLWEPFEKEPFWKEEDKFLIVKRLANIFERIGLVTFFHHIYTIFRQPRTV